MLGGGIELGAITEVYGEAGSGKTNLCIQYGRNVARQGKKVLFIDTEGISLERLHQMAEDDFEEILDRFLIWECFDFAEQERAVRKGCKLARERDDIGILIVDSLTMHYRIGSDDRSTRKDLTGQMLELVGVARKRRIPILITSQVYTNISKGVFEPLGSHPVHHNAKAILRFEVVGTGGLRKVTVMKHRAVAEGEACLVRLAGEGIVSPRHTGDELGPWTADQLE